MKITVQVIIMVNGLDQDLFKKNKKIINTYIHTKWAQMLKTLSDPTSGFHLSRSVRIEGFR